MAFAGLREIFISILSGSIGLLSLLVGHHLDVVSGGGESECQSVSIADLDLVYIDLDAAILTDGSTIAAIALSSILVLEDLQIIGGQGHRCPMPGNTKGQSPVISYGHGVYISILKPRETECRSLCLEYSAVLSENIYAAHAAHILCKYRN